MTLTREPASVPAEPTTPIKPSEAIRLGCLTYPVQAFGSFRANHAGEGCAMDAMFAGLGEPEDVDLRTAVIDRLAIPCPDGHEHGSEAWGVGVGRSVAAHLNDGHRWSREAIATWLEGLGL